MIVTIRYSCICDPESIWEQVMDPGRRRRRRTYNGCNSLEEADTWVRENGPRLEGFRLFCIEHIDVDKLPVFTAKRQADEGSTDAKLVHKAY